MSRSSHKYSLPDFAVVAPLCWGVSKARRQSAVATEERLMQSTTLRRRKLVWCRQCSKRHDRAGRLHRGISRFALV